MSTYSTQQWARAMALLFGACFILCLVWNYLLTDPALKALHMDLLRMSLFGFAGIDVASIVLGMIQSLFWGYVTGWVLAWCLNYCKK